MSGFFRSSRALYSAAKAAAAEYPKPKLSYTVATAATPKKRPTETTPKTAATPKKNTTTTPRKPPKEMPKSTGSVNALTKEVAISPVLGSFVGAPEISRAQATKKIWDHIKVNNLQNPTNKREIICDDKLKKIFDVRDRIGMMEIAKLMSPHFVKVAS